LVKSSWQPDRKETLLMKIAVMGAGAVGCYYGFKLARAGHDVVLIGRPQHVQGLRLETQTFDEHIGVSASTGGSAVQGAQLVLFCVKSTDTESAAAAIKPHLASDAVVLSLQNGVESADRLRALLPQEVVAAAVYVGTEMAGPGHVRHHGRGELVIEQSKASDDPGAPADRSRRPDRHFGQRARRAVGEADPGLRVQRAIGDYTIAVWPARER
jgi:2-dehydropantoate 2-reductase